MESGPPAHKSLVLALRRARERLTVLQMRQREELPRAQSSLEEATAAVLREEERLRVSAQEKRSQLQQELATLQQANQREAQAQGARIQALQHQLGILHRRLLASPEAELSADTAREVANLLARSGPLTLTLTRVRFEPQQEMPALGELQQEKHVFGLPPSKGTVGVGPGQREAAGAKVDTGKWTETKEVGHPEPSSEAQEGRRAASATKGMPPVGKGQGGEDLGGATPASKKPAVSSREPPGRSRSEAENPGTEAATRAEPGPPPPGETQGPLNLGSAPGTLFHARAVWVQEENSDGSNGEMEGSRAWRDVAVLSSRGPSAREPLPRWASAESLGRLRGTRPGAGGACLGGSCMELVEEASTSQGLASGLSRTQLAPGGADPAVPSPARSPSSQFPQETPGLARWLAAQHARILPRSPCLPAPPCDQLVGQWGQWGSQAGQLCLPHGLCAVPATGSLYVVDFGNRRLQELGGAQRVLPLRGKAYFDVARGRGGCLALTNASGRSVELYSARGALLQAMTEGFQSPRGLATHTRGELLVADTPLGVLHVLGVTLARGGQPLQRRDTIRGFHKPYLVATNSCGEVAVSERGLDGGCCVKVLGPTWQVLRVLGSERSPPRLTNPWGVSLDEAGRVLVADWGRHDHTVFCYSQQGRGWAVVTKGLSSPRGVALLGERHLMVADSMHHCLKAFLYC